MSRCRLLILILVAALSFPVLAIDATTFKREPPPDANANSEAFGPELYSHEKIYLIGGGSPEFDLKFQVSFKARIASSVYLGYTQLNAWDVSKSSSPFRDTTHKLSLFWYPPREQKAEGDSVHISGGYEHNSNGRDGDSSRSIDMLFIRPRLFVAQENARYWQVTPKLFHYIKMSSNNADISRYREFIDLEIANLDPESWAASLALRTGRSGLSSTQVDISQSLRKLGWDVPGYAMLQVFRGYGETLLDYNRKVASQVRIGYLFERGQ